jgi:hypothetical protein
VLSGECSLGGEAQDSPEGTQVVRWGGLWVFWRRSGLVTTTLMIIGGFVLIIVLVFVGFQLLKPEHLKLKINWHSLELEMRRASEQKAVPKKLPQRRKVRSD